MTTSSNEPIVGGDPTDDEVDVEPFEGEPDFEDAPWTRTGEGELQDDGEDS